MDRPNTCPILRWLSAEDQQYLAASTTYKGYWLNVSLVFESTVGLWSHCAHVQYWDNSRRCINNILLSIKNPTWPNMPPILSRLSKQRRKCLLASRRTLADPAHFQYWDDFRVKIKNILESMRRTSFDPMCRQDLSQQSDIAKNSFLPSNPTRIAPIDVQYWDDSQRCVNNILLLIKTQRDPICP